MRASSINLNIQKFTALAQEERSKIVPNATKSGIPCDSDEEAIDIPYVYKVTGYCDVFNLSKDEDRKRYGDLSAKFEESAGTYAKLWEERQFSKSDLIIYMAYLTYLSTNKGVTKNEQRFK